MGYIRDTQQVRAVIIARYTRFVYIGCAAVELASQSVLYLRYGVNDRGAWGSQAMLTSGTSRSLQPIEYPQKLAPSLLQPTT